MKVLKSVASLLVVCVVLFALGAWSTFGYGLHCVRCLAEKHANEVRLFGVPVYRSTSKLYQAPDYELIIGQPCQHIFRKGGFGRGRYSLRGCSIGCGQTWEGSVFGKRKEAIAATFKLHQQLGQRQLALATLRAIDLALPPDASLDRGDPRSDASKETLFYLPQFLGQAQTADEWRKVLAASETNFRDQSGLPSGQ